MKSCLSVKECILFRDLIDDVSFDLHKGEILGFGGLSESGMHEIGKAIFGASYDRDRYGDTGRRNPDQRYSDCD